jgi:hypothetical protein
MRNKKAKVKDKDALVRDLHSKAIINTDKSSYNNYRQRKANRMKIKNDISDLQNEIHMLKMLIANLTTNK